MVAEVSFPRGSSRPAKKDVPTQQSETKKLRPSQKRKAESKENATVTASSVKKDVLFGSSDKQDEVKTSSLSKRRKTEDASGPASNKNSLLPLGGGGVVVTTKKHTLKVGDKKSMSTTTVHIESLGFSKMAKGSKVLACVREVHEQFVIVSLPNLLTAYILPQSKSSQQPKYPLTNTLQVGQTLAVVVTKIAVEQVKGGESRRRIQVSALPQAVNPRNLLSGESINSNPSITSAANRLARASVPLRGQIQSVEDHGCVIDLGFGRRGFLRFDQVDDKNYVILDEDEEYEDEEDDDPSKRPIILQKGRICDFFVLPVTTKSGEDEYATTIFPLSLPKIQTMAKKTVSSLTSNVSTRGGKRGKNKTTTIPFSFSSLMPGWLVQVKVEAIANNGLCVSLFGNVFRGALEMNHLGVTLVPDANDKAAAGGRDGGFKKLAYSLFQEHQHFTARIVAVDVPTKLVRLSMAPHILSLLNPGEPRNPIREFPPIGIVVPDCTVVKLDPGIGALLALPSQYNIETTPLLPKSLMNSCDLFQNTDFQEAIHIRKVYVHISKAFDESGEVDTEQRAAITAKFHKEFAPSSTHDVRILNTGHWLDGVATGGCASTIIKAPVLSHDDLIPGKVYKQVPICKHLPGGSVLVELGGGGVTRNKKKKSKSTNPYQISGLLPPAQLFDVVSGDSSEYRQRVFKTKYAIDAKVDVRVLWVDSLRKKCLVSAKKTFVQAPPEKIITNYADAKVGQVGVGFVSKIDDQGIYITFCNRVYGKVTARSLAAELGVEDHRENYSVGDVVTSRVIKLKEVVRKSSTFQTDDDNYDDEMDFDDDEQSTPRRKHWELTLSLKLHKDEGEDDEMEEEEVDIQSPKQVRLVAGAILPEKSMKIVELVDGKTKKSGAFVPGYAIVSIKSKYLVDEDSLGKSKMLSYIECKLPYHNLLDSFDPADTVNAESLDALAKRTLTVGKKIKQEGLVLEDPRKQIVDYASRIGTMPVVSLRKLLIQTRKDQRNAEGVQPENLPIVPQSDKDLFVGAHFMGFVVQVDPRHGAFVRFLDGMTGMVHIKDGGLKLRLYDTLVTKVKVIDDSVHPHRFLLEPVLPSNASSTKKQQNKQQKHIPFKAGDIIPKAKVSSINFEEASLTTESGDDHYRLLLHCTGKSSDLTVIKRSKKSLSKQSSSSKRITKCHPFYGLKKGEELQDLIVVSVQRNKVWVEEKNKDKDASDKTSTLNGKTNRLKSGRKIKGVVAAHGKENGGIFVHVGPGIMGFVPGLELSRDVKLLNNLQSYVPLGATIECIVIKVQTKGSSEDPFSILSVLACQSNSPKSSSGDLIVGRINKSAKQVFAPSLMLDLRQGTGVCCITELNEPDEWENMPLGQTNPGKDDPGDKVKNENDESEESDGNDSDDAFPNKKYVECRVLNINSHRKFLNVSLRPSRIDGDLDDDPTPNVGDIVQGYVIQTTKKGCFVRFSRAVEGRSTLKELCDGYIANPTSSFPTGRLVVGKIKETRSVSKKKTKDSVTIQADVDMRESVLVEDDEKLLSFEDINVGTKYVGTVQTVTSYGVFVRIENSNVDGLVHLSESSDDFVKNLQSLYSPGDPVKILVIKKDDEIKKLAFSMKPSHFADDDSDDSSVESDVEMEDSDGDDNIESMEIENDSSDGLNSDDENFAAKLAAKMGSDNDDDSAKDEDESSSEDDTDDSDDDDDENSSSEDESDDEKKVETLDTNVGFSWDASALGKNAGIATKEDQEDSSDESDSESDEDDSDSEKPKSRKSRKRQAERRREEQEISRRETALADGTADENPETVGDFERILAGDPNNSELWIRYMAFHLSLADIPAARKVAEKAMERIEFRQENEKLNIWSALLKLEHKFGNEETFKETTDNACKQNNPKYVYLRACEILANDVELSAKDPESISKADALFKKMCKKHKSKKKVWLAHMEYLLKQSRHEDAQALMKRAMLSLEPRKHCEVMSKYAQMEFELGNPERGRTLFDGILLKHPKRLDLYFVYLDKECKCGSIEHARTLLEKKVEERKLSDRQMKSVFKKWYKIETEHGTEETQEHVMESARNYVSSSRN